MGNVRIAKDWFKSEWSDVFQLDAASPSGLSWKITGNNKVTGKPVGWLTDLNYWKCEYKCKAILVHRIIYYLNTGQLDETKVIDHIDGNPQNNCIENLREISYAENSRNKKMARNNRTGITGIHENHDLVVTWSENGRTMSKKFSAIKLGYDKALGLALKFREEKLTELNQQLYNYSGRHGK